jgi:dihydroflavonol-4-reductase
VKILVTGASGFIGRALTQKLVQIGHDVRVIGRTNQDAELRSKRDVEFIKADITDPKSLSQALKSVHSVFHLAGLIGYSRSMHQAMVQVNVMGTSHMLDAAIANGVERFVHMSSVVAVGASFDGTPLTEDSAYNLSHLNLGYFETKRRAEQLVVEASRTGKLHTVCVNPSTVYGPGDATKGSRSVQIKVAKGSFPFYTSGGVNVIHVNDVINATYRAWEVGRRGERYILAGENLKIKKLFYEIARSAGVNPPRIFLPNWLLHGLGKFGDYLETKGKKGPVNSETAWTSTLYHWFDNAKARRELGLNPRPAIEAIQESVGWMKANGVI